MPPAWEQMFTAAHPNILSRAAEEVKEQVARGGAAHPLPRLSLQLALAMLLLSPVRPDFGVTAFRFWKTKPRTPAETLAKPDGASPKYGWPSLRRLEVTSKCVTSYEQACSGSRLLGCPACCQL